MVDNSTVCCMCGDVGFSDKLFHCTGCRFRFQHSYCSSYYVEPPEAVPSLCDWCRSEERSSNAQGSHSKRSAAGKDAGASSRSEHSGDKIKQKDGDESRDRGKNAGGSPSPRTSGRRYKLLKDVLC